jgi:hypothetical protein
MANQQALVLLYVLDNSASLNFVPFCQNMNAVDKSHMSNRSRKGYLITPSHINVSGKEWQEGRQGHLVFQMNADELQCYCRQGCKPAGGRNIGCTRPPRQPNDRIAQGGIGNAILRFW